MRASEFTKRIKSEDYDPNGPPPGPEFKPTMPKGTVRVDVSDVYDWYKLGQHISNLKGLGKHDFGKGPPSTIMAFGDEDTEHKYIQDLMKTGLSTTDIDPASHKKIKGQKVDPTFNVNETFEQGYPLEWEESEFGDYDVTAKLPDGTNLSILFSQEGSSNNESKWVVSFYRDNSTDITGQGDALKIFATVLDALEEFTYREDPDTIMFHAVKADDPKGSRAKLYDRMVKRYASHAGYNVQQQVDSEGAGYYLQKTKSMRESASK